MPKYFSTLDVAQCTALSDEDDGIIFLQRQNVQRNAMYAIIL